MVVPLIIKILVGMRCQEKGETKFFQDMHEAVFSDNWDPAWKKTHTTF